MIIPSGEKRTSKASHGVLNEQGLVSLMVFDDHSQLNHADPQTLSQCTHAPVEYDDLPPSRLHADPTHDLSALHGGTENIKRLLVVLGGPPCEVESRNLSRRVQGGSIRGVIRLMYSQNEITASTGPHDGRWDHPPSCPPRASDTLSRYPESRVRGCNTSLRKRVF